MEIYLYIYVYIVGGLNAYIRPTKEVVVLDFDTYNNNDNILFPYFYDQN